MEKVKGQIIKQISNTYTVDVCGEIYECKARGKFRNMKVTPLVGDFVILGEVMIHTLIY